MSEKQSILSAVSMHRAMQSLRNYTLTTLNCFALLHVWPWTFYL